MDVDLIFRSHGQVFRMNDEVSRNFYFVMLYNNSLSRNSDLGRTQVFCATYDLLSRKFDLVKYAAMLRFRNKKKTSRFSLSILVYIRMIFLKSE